MFRDAGCFVNLDTGSVKYLTDGTTDQITAVKQTIPESWIYKLKKKYGIKVPDVFGQPK